MASTFSPLKVELIATGEQSGTWGTTTNVNLGTALEEAITGSADVTFASGNVTVTLTDVNTTQTARNLRLNLVGTSSGTHSLILGSGCNIEKLYLVNNTLANDITVVNTAGGSSVTVPAGKSMFIYNTGTNVVDAITHINNASGTFTSLNVTGNTTLGDASADTITLNGTVQPGVVVSGSSSGDAFRITQTGTGNAFVVEDSANPDSTPFVIDGTGRLIQGASSALIAGYSTSIFSVGSNSPLLVGWTGASSTGAYFDFYKNRNADWSANATVIADDVIGRMNFFGADGTSYIPAARIEARIDGTPGTNDMPGRLVFSTTADGASSPTERMRIGQNGNIGIGVANRADSSFTLSKTLTGATSVFGILNNGTIQSDVTSTVLGMSTGFGTQAATFTLANLQHYRAIQGTFGAGSTVTNQFGYLVDATITGATNNYGFYSNIPSGTGRWNFYANGTAANYFAGNVGIGTTTTNVALSVNGTIALPAATTENRAIEIGASRTGDGLAFIDFIGDATYTDYGLRIIRNAGANAVSSIETRGTGPLRLNALDAGSIELYTTNALRGVFGANGKISFGGSGIIAAASTLINIPIFGATNSTGISLQGQVLSDVTSLVDNYRSALFTQAAAFTLPEYRHFRATQGTIGAGSTVTTQIGFLADNSLIGATNNFGFRSDIASGTGRWNFYANGTADNYFAGFVLIGNTANITSLGYQQGLQVTRASGTIGQIRWSTDTGAPETVASKARGSSVSPTIVASGDGLWLGRFSGYDGANFIEAARITANVDGTPGLNDMPGRLIFSTTADGASSPTERMRIDSAGNVGIGTGSPSERLTVSGNASLSGNLTFTGTGNRITGDFSNGTIASRVMFQSSTTNNTTIVGILPNGTGTEGRLTILNNSDPTLSSGFDLRSTTTEAMLRANNYGGGALPMTFHTGGSERMRIDTSGNVGIGTSSPSTYDSKLAVVGNIAMANTGSKLYAYYVSATNYAALSSSAGGDMTFITGVSSPAERMRIDSSGNINIATTGARITGDFSNATVANRVAFQTSTTNGNTIIGAIPNGTGSISTFQAQNASDPTNAAWIRILASSTDTRLDSGISGTGTYLPMTFFTGGSERMRIDSSGNLLVGTATVIRAGKLSISFADASSRGIVTKTDVTTSSNAILFTNPNGDVGSISTSGTSTSYATSSDYRLKDNIAPMTGALETVAQLKPVTYSWKADGSDGQGFIAHELQEVVPDCVTGEKDGVDAEGNPVYQGIDTSFLVATLTAAIQELSAKVDTLQAELNTLKGN